MSGFYSTTDAADAIPEWARRYLGATKEQVRAKAVAVNKTLPAPVVANKLKILGKIMIGVAGAVAGAYTVKYLKQWGML